MTKQKIFTFEINSLAYAFSFGKPSALAQECLLKYSSEDIAAKGFFEGTCFIKNFESKGHVIARSFVRNGVAVVEVYSRKGVDNFYRKGDVKSFAHEAARGAVRRKLAQDARANAAARINFTGLDPVRYMAQMAIVEKLSEESLSS